MRFFSLIGVFCLALNVQGTPLEELKGTYTILESDSVIQSAGVLEIFEDSDNLGFSSSPLPMATYPVTPIKVSTPKATTTVEKSSDRITQKFIGQNHETDVVDYFRSEGLISIQSETCSDNGTCQKHQIVATTGKALGDKVDTKSFFAKLPTKFTIQIAGQKPPHTPEASQGSLDTASDPEEAGFELPFCTDTGCDPGLYGFIYKNTEVFTKKLRDGRVFYSIVTKKGAKLLLFGWEESQGVYFFRHFQYSIQGKRVSLEYQLQKN